MALAIDPLAGSRHPLPTLDRAMAVLRAAPEPVIETVVAEHKQAGRASTSDFFTLSFRLFCPILG